MHVRRLQLTNFRNYSRLELDLAPGRLLFLGANAQGKSNLLEAVQLLASGRSVRAANDSELIGWQAEAAPQPFARLLASVERRAGAVQLETLVVGTNAAPASEGPVMPAGRAGKRYRVNGIARRAVDFVGQLRAVLFTADDLDVISGPPALRRNYLDAALSQRDRSYYLALQRYGRILQQRNASLRRIREGIAGPDELSLWDDGLAQEAATIIAARQAATRRLGELAAAAQVELSDAREELDLLYEPQIGDEWRRLLPPAGDAAAVRPLFTAALAAQRRREVAAGVTLVGPHRDELLVRLNGVAAAAFGSRAQIRTVALAMRLAEARLFRDDSGDPPVVLLDDIVSELDEQRRRSVLAGVADFEQVWFTATTASWLPEDFVSSSTVYEVRSSEVELRA